MENRPDPTPPAESGSLEDLEIDLLLEAVYRHSGQDFRSYARASLRRRIRGVVQEERLGSISGLQERALHDPACAERFLLALSVPTTGMFRDPDFFRAFRERVTPLLRTYPFVRVWCAGCSTGEEVYSTAILLEEEGLYSRCRIYATDLNGAVLAKARGGIFPLSLMKEYAGHHLKSGGKGSFSDYYTAAYDSAIFRSSLKKNIVFAQHNLATDASFNEFNVILCRNVMIYFNRSLQERVHNLLYDSLALFGALGLGDRESLRFSPHEKDYEALAGREKIYRRIR